MNLVLTDNGNRKDSDNLFEYLMEYMYGVLNTVKGEYSIRLIKDQIFDLRKQHLKALANNKFIVGWKS